MSVAHWWKRSLSPAGRRRQFKMDPEMARTLDQLPLHMQTLSEDFSHYLQSYAKVSLELFGRWPAFVPEESRNSAALESLGTFETGPEAPPELNAPSDPSVAREGGADGGQDGQGSAVEKQMREKLSKLTDKYRQEVTERTKANAENVKRGQQLQAAQRDIRLLQENLQRQATQLQAARDMTIKLEDELRGERHAISQADRRMGKERKERIKWQLRSEKLQAKLEPMAEAHETVMETLRQTESMLGRSQSGGAEAKREVERLTAEKEKLRVRAERMHRSMAAAQEEGAETELHLTLMADKRDEVRRLPSSARSTSRHTPGPRCLAQPTASLPPLRAARR